MVKANSHWAGSWLNAVKVIHLRVRDVDPGMAGLESKTVVRMAVVEY